MILTKPRTPTWATIRLLAASPKRRPPRRFRRKVQVETVSAGRPGAEAQEYGPFRGMSGVTAKAENSLAEGSSLAANIFSLWFAGQDRASGQCAPPTSWRPPTPVRPSPFRSSLPEQQPDQGASRQPARTIRSSQRRTPSALGSRVGTGQGCRAHDLTIDDVDAPLVFLGSPPAPGALFLSRRYLGRAGLAPDR